MDIRNGCNACGPVKLEAQLEIGRPKQSANGEYRKEPSENWSTEQ